MAKMVNVEPSSISVVYDETTRGALMIIRARGGPYVVALDRATVDQLSGDFQTAVACAREYCEPEDEEEELE
jgi:hypothetical protein